LLQLIYWGGAQEAHTWLPPALRLTMDVQRRKTKCYITEMLFNLFNILKRMMEAVRSEGHVIGSKVSAWELEQVKQLVTSVFT
jgi:hypothetical protein